MGVTYYMFASDFITSGTAHVTSWSISAALLLVFIGNDRRLPAQQAETISTATMSPRINARKWNVPGGACKPEGQGVGTHGYQAEHVGACGGGTAQTTWSKGLQDRLPTKMTELWPGRALEGTGRDS